MSSDHMSPDHKAALLRLARKMEPAKSKPMERRVFLKFAGIGGLGLACSEAVNDMNEGGVGAAQPGGRAGAPGTDVGLGTEGGAANGLGEDGQSATSFDDQADGASTGPGQPPGPPVVYTELTVSIHIGDDDGVTFYVGQSDMGQGILTALAMMLAEELEVDWRKVRSEHPENQEAYPGWATFGSASVANAYERDNLLAVAAAAREMLVSAAALRLEVPAGQLRAELGEVIHDASNRRLGYGELVDLAATLTPPQNPTIVSSNPARANKIIGTPRAQINAREKASGTAQYTLDIQVPNMLVGLVARPPSVGGSVQSFDATLALGVPGVQDVVQISSGIAVLADHYWAALKGREALTVQWNEGPNANLSTDSFTATLSGIVDTGVDRLAQPLGNPQQVLAAAPANRQLDVVYQLPYLAHAPMEPLNAVADVRGDSVELWVGTQSPGPVVQQATELTGVNANNITIHVPLLGGAFGRRGVNDFAVDAIEASREARRPVKLVYSREDDMRSASYRPMNYNRLRGSVDALGRPDSWIHNVAVQGIFGGFFATEGASTNYPYNIANRQVTWADPQQGVPVFTWRSVGSSQNGFIVESFIDELADLGGQDPLEARLQMLADSNYEDAERQAAALQNVADRSAWSTPPAAGRARGIAVHQTFGTIVAQVAEISIESGRVRVHEVWAAVDCGEAVNPRGVEAQCEGSIVFGMSAALYGKIDLENGRPVQGNFDSYRLVRMSEAPVISVEILSSGKGTTGMGEPGVPPIAPAICNAIFRLTGQRIRQLPIGDQLQG